MRQAFAGPRPYVRSRGRLRAPVDLYFDKVMVMVEDPQVRANRLGVLNYLLVTFTQDCGFVRVGCGIERAAIVGRGSILALMTHLH